MAYHSGSWEMLNACLFQKTIFQNKHIEIAINNLLHRIKSMSRDKNNTQSLSKNLKEDIEK